MCACMRRQLASKGKLAADYICMGVLAKRWAFFRTSRLKQSRVETHKLKCTHPLARAEFDAHRDTLN